MKKTLYIVGAFVVFLVVSIVLMYSKNAQTTKDTTSEVEQPAIEVVTGVTDNVAFDLTGTNFAFDVTEIRVHEGDTVTINFESKDGFHDWMLDEFNAATLQVNPGTKTSVTFVADRVGEYEYYCSVGRHREMGMVGKFIVEAK